MCTNKMDGYDGGAFEAKFFVVDGEAAHRTTYSLENKVFTLGFTSPRRPSLWLRSFYPVRNSLTRI